MDALLIVFIAVASSPFFASSCVCSSSLNPNLSISFPSASRLSSYPLAEEETLVACSIPSIHFKIISCILVGGGMKCSSAISCNNE